MTAPADLEADAMVSVNRTTWIGSAIIAAVLSPVLAALLLAISVGVTQPEADNDAPAMIAVWGSIIAIMWVSPVALIFGALISNYLQRMSTEKKISIIARGAIMGAVIGGAYGILLQLRPAESFAEFTRAFPILGLVVGFAAGIAVSLNVLADRRLQLRLAGLRRDSAV